jgi:hypothetical protein
MEPKTVVCACGGTFTLSSLARHAQGCPDWWRQRRTKSTRTEEQRGIASELRESLEDHENAQSRLREAEAVVLRAREYAAITEADLATWRSKAAAVGFAGADAATAESIRAWLFASPTVEGEGEATPRPSK